MTHDSILPTNRPAHPAPRLAKHAHKHNGSPQVAALALLAAEPWYRPFRPGSGSGGATDGTGSPADASGAPAPLEASRAPENAALFVVSLAQVWLAAAAFNAGPPHRAPLARNRWLVAVLVCFFVMASFPLILSFCVCGSYAWGAQPVASSCTAPPHAPFLTALPLYHYRCRRQQSTTTQAAQLALLLYFLLSPVTYPNGASDPIVASFAELVPLPLPFRLRLAALIAANAAATAAAQWAAGALVRAAPAVRRAALAAARAWWRRWRRWRRWRG